MYPFTCYEGKKNPVDVRSAKYQAEVSAIKVNNLEEEAIPEMYPVYPDAPKEVETSPAPMLFEELINENRKRSFINQNQLVKPIPSYITINQNLTPYKLHLRKVFTFACSDMNKHGIAVCC